MSSPFGRRVALLGGAVLAVAFAVGAVSGIALDRGLAPRAPVMLRVGDFSGVLDRLDLSTGQRARVQALLERSAPRSEAVLRQAAERLRLVVDSVDAELREILTPAQRARLDSLRREPVFVIKRKSAGGTTRVDTLPRSGRDPGR